MNRENTGYFARRVLQVRKRNDSPNVDQAREFEVLAEGRGRRRLHAAREQYRGIPGLTKTKTISSFVSLPSFRSPFVFCICILFFAIFFSPSPLPSLYHA